MDRFSSAALLWLTAGLFAIGLPFAVGIYTYDLAANSRYNLPPPSLSVAGSGLLIGAIIGAFSFVPILVLSLKVTNGTTITTGIMLGLAIQMMLFGAAAVFNPTAPFLNGDGGYQAWAAIIGSVLASIIIVQRSTRLKALGTL